MKIFLDTSSLVKLYFEESGTEELDSFLSENQVTGIFLSEIAKVEFKSAIFKKVRTKHISKEDADELVRLFIDDYDKYDFISVSNEIIELSGSLIEKYCDDGLRALDAIQLSCAIAKKDEFTYFKTADTKLQECFEKEK